MKQFVITIMLSLLLLVACDGADVLPTIVPTAPLPTSTSAAPRPTIVPTIQLSTAPPEFIEITNTPHPPADTPTPRAAATEIPTGDSQNLPLFSLPTMEGKILFVWTPGIKPDPAIGGEDDTVFNGLYMASPSGADSEWTVDTIIGETAISKTSLSPDQTKLAFLYLEDTNGNGRYHNLDGDIYKLGVYDIAKNSITTLDIDGYMYGLSWVNDQTLVISQNTNFAFIKIDGTSPIWLTDNPSQSIEGKAYNLVNSVTSSPDGQLQAIAQMLGIGISDGRIQPTGEIQLSIYNVLTDQSIPVITDNEPSHSLYIATAWSPDSQWLAVVPGYKSDNLTLVNSHTLETIPFSTNSIEDMVVDLPAWSHDSQWLSFVANGQDLWFWDTSTFIQYETANKIITGRETVWSPQGKHVVVSFTEGAKAGWLIVDPASGASDEFYIDTIPYGTPVWSPDGKWILFPATQGEMSGYYILDTQSGAVSLVFDTTGLREFSDLIWIEN